MLIDAPLPEDVPPHEPVYHCHVAPVPKVPPDSVKVIAMPGQTVSEGDPETNETAVDKAFTVIVALTQVVVLQVPCART